MRNPFRCCICNKFLSYSSARYTWTPYGNSFDIEPPDEQMCHKKCYEDLSKKGKDLIIYTSWMKPFLLDTEKRKTVD